MKPFVLTSIFLFFSLSVSAQLCSMQLDDPDALLTSDQLIESSQLSVVSHCSGSDWIVEIVKLECPSGVQYLGMRSTSGLYIFNYSHDLWFGWCYESAKGQYYHDYVKDNVDAIIVSYDQEKSICRAYTKGGDRCSRLSSNEYCWQHKN